MTNIVVRLQTLHTQRKKGNRLKMIDEIEVKWSIKMNNEEGLSKMLKLHTFLQGQGIGSAFSAERVEFEEDAMKT